jgi:hypothetical protein
MAREVLPHSLKQFIRENCPARDGKPRFQLRYGRLNLCYFSGDCCEHQGSDSEEYDIGDGRAYRRCKL